MIIFLDCVWNVLYLWRNGSAMTAAHICILPKEDLAQSVSCEIILTQVSAWGFLFVEIVWNRAHMLRWSLQPHWEKECLSHVLKNHSCLCEKRQGRRECSHFTEKKVDLCSPETVGCILYQSLSHIWLFGTPWPAARQASLSFTISWSLLKLMAPESMMLSDYLILCWPPLLLLSIFPSIRVFSNELAFLVVAKVLVNGEIYPSSKDT